MAHKQLILTILVVSLGLGCDGRDGLFGSRQGSHSHGKTVAVQAAQIELKPEVRQILEQSGWLQFVTANLDQLVYVSGQTFGQNLVGLAHIEQDTRIVQIARDQTPEDMAATLVHEAAHLAPYRATGQAADEAQAQAVEAQFWKTFRQAQKRAIKRVARATQRPSSWAAENDEALPPADDIPSADQVVIEIVVNCSAGK